ncbi:MAG: hypothetical protein HC880_06890 [Bacteroidia bacterium]|nr:hypothetical protein [Bacteroidia bacterium]
MEKSDLKYSYKSHHYPRIVEKHTDMDQPWEMKFYLYDVQKKRPVLIRHKSQIIKNFKAREQYFKKLAEKFKNWMDEGYVISEKVVEKQALTVSLHEAIERVMQYKKTMLEPETMKDYIKLRNRIKEWQTYRGYNLFLAEMDKKKALDFMDWLKEVRRVENKTYCNYLGTAHTTFDYYLRREMIKTNPFANIPRPKFESGKHEPFTQEQKQQIFDWAKAFDEQFYLFVNFCYYTCARPHSEVRFLKISDIKEKTIHFRSSNAKNKQGYHIRLAKPLADLIREYKLTDYDPSFYLFTRQGEPGPEPVSEHFFYRRFRKCLEALQIFDTGDYDLYGLKHTRIIYLMHQVTKFSQLKAIQELARHATLKQIELYARRYGIIFPFNDEKGLLDLE